MKVLTEIEINSINHLGIVAGIIDELQIVDIINQELGIDEQEIVNSGEIVKAILINGLGFVSQPLYLFPKFFEDKATEHLLGKGILPEHLNDYKIGRVMDKLYNYGLSNLFLLIALTAAKKYQINLDFSHLDSSCFSVHGQYNQASCSEEQLTKKELDEDRGPIPITITHGYSRDHRPDLKQFILDLIVTGDGNIPVFIEAASGNQSDKKAFGQIAKNYKKQLKLETTIVGDSALYSKDNLGLLKQIKWLTRVPLSIKEAKNLVNEVSSSELSKSELPGYSFVEKTSNYGGVPQRWLVVESETRAESDKKSLEKKITKEKEIIQKKVAKLFKKTFDSATEAELSLRQIQSKLKYHLISEIEIRENQIIKQNNTYQITAKIQPRQDIIESYKKRAGRFIIATNRLDNQVFTAELMLKKYKEQQNVERGFAFLKDPLFFADSIFLKSPHRIETMAMLMGLCLMVYSLGQREVRYQLSQAKTGVPNQLGKLTARPTLRWIFQCFQGIHLLIHQGTKQVVNLTEERLFTLKFFPLSCQKYYILSG
ncbi:MAG: IS1634 family transposase [Xenococcaceae cyanobacterium MO_188.B19]|nr:IS1634 family transposase [Xenococcaceae cyanobacterium MO_188.B19]